MHSALDMTRYWRQLDSKVAQTPMPKEYQNMMVEVRGQPPTLGVHGAVPRSYWQQRALGTCAGSEVRPRGGE